MTATRTQLARIRYAHKNEGNETLHDPAVNRKQTAPIDLVSGSLSEDFIQDASPHRPTLLLGLQCLMSFPVDLPASRVDVDIVQREPATARVEVAPGVEKEHHRKRQVVLEEVVGGERLDGGVELCDENKDHKTETDV